MKLVTRGALVRLALLAMGLAGIAAWAWVEMMRMPGASYRGPLAPLTAEDEALRDELRRDVWALAGEIGERNLFVPRNLARAVEYLEAAFTAAGYPVRRQTYEIGQEVFPASGVERIFHNLEVERAGTVGAAEVVVVGAHYDTVIGAPGANDNATGTAALLALARRFAARTPSRTIRFVAFTNEELFFRRPQMGSLVYARAIRQRGDRVVTMLSLETIGSYSDRPGSQSYPPPFSFFYPSTGNFVAFVGNVASRTQVREAIGAFRRRARFPSEGLAFPNILPGIGWSDHWAFWQAGYPGVMVTDTALYRYRAYHTPEDTPEKVDYDRLARVVHGLDRVLVDLADAGRP